MQKALGPPQLHPEPPNAGTAAPSPHQSLLLPLHTELLQAELQVVPLEVREAQCGILQRAVQQQRIPSLHSIVHLLQSRVHCRGAQQGSERTPTPNKADISPWKRSGATAPHEGERAHGSPLALLMLPWISSCVRQQV